MNSERSYRVNSGKVSHENIEGETMAINFETGAYYNLRDSALAVWERLIEGATLDDLVRDLCRRYSGNSDEIRRGVSSFLDELVREDLVVSSQTAAAAGSDAGPSTVDVQPFVPPKLDKYTDMQDFLLADPVHDTDEAGFPIPRTERTDPN